MKCILPLMTQLAWFRLNIVLVEPMLLCTVPHLIQMAPATQVHRPIAGTSFTKAGMGRGLQQPLQQCQRASIWVNKLTDAGCLA